MKGGRERWNMTSVFGDTRLDKRLEALKTAIREIPAVSLPQMLNSWSQLKAGYRFFK
jgi:Transposase DNA-binding